jgi:hypothetical protein
MMVVMVFMFVVMVAFAVIVEVVEFDKGMGTDIFFRGVVVEGGPESAMISLKWFGVHSK